MLEYERATVKCSECPLNYRTKVWGRGSLQKHDRGIIFLGEAPGEKEDELGVPFVGKAGKVLDDAMERLGIDRSEEWVTNALSCRPPNNDFKSEEAQVARDKCRPGMREELELLKEYGYGILVPLGNNACKSIGISGGITRIRGSEQEKMDFLVIPTYHPSYVARGLPVDEEEREKNSRWYSFLQDLIRVKEAQSQA